MEFNNTLPEWKNEGIAPSENLRTNGFQAGDRPAAATFNWFWSKVPKAVTEIQDSLNNVEKNVNNSFSKIESSLGMTKSKNLLKNTAGTTTQNGITFTHNSDGSVTCNGTATADTNYRYIITLPIDTSFILSGCPTGGSTSTYNLFAMDADTWSKIYRDTSSSVIFNTGTCKTWHFIIRVANGQTVSNMTFYPMLRNAVTYANDTSYEPYSDDLQTQIDNLNAMTEDSGWIQIKINASGGEAWYRKYGKVVELRCAAVLLDSGLNEWNICTLPEGYRPSVMEVEGVARIFSGHDVYKMTVSEDGNVSISSHSGETLPYHTTYSVHACFLVG